MKFFQSIKTNMELVDIIRSDVYDLKFVRTRHSNKYFISFVDDRTNIDMVAPKRISIMKSLDIFVKYII